MLVENDKQARVPNQLVNLDDDEKDKKESDEDDMNEFSAVGGGAIVGYAAPLGATSEDMGVKGGRRKKPGWHLNSKLFF